MPANPPDIAALMAAASLPDWGGKFPTEPGRANRVAASADCDAIEAGMPESGG